MKREKKKNRKSDFRVYLLAKLAAQNSQVEGDEYPLFTERRSQ